MSNERKEWRKKIFLKSCHSKLKSLLKIQNKGDRSEIRAKKITKNISAWVKERKSRRTRNVKEKCASRLMRSRKSIQIK